MAEMADPNPSGELKGPDIDQGLETLTQLVREDKEIGHILCRYIERVNTGDRAVRADCLAMASSESAAKKADELLDVVDLLLLLKKKKQGEGGG